jgi:hypothetical protein
MPEGGEIPYREGELLEQREKQLNKSSTITQKKKTGIRQIAKTIGIGVKPEKRNDIRIIQGKDYSEQTTKEARLIRERVNQAYKHQGNILAQQDLGAGRDAILSLPHNLRNDTLHDIATTLVECSDILGVNIPDVHFRLKTEGLLTSMGENYNTAALVTSKKLFSRPRLEINLVYLTALNSAYAQLPPGELTSIKEGMQKAFAEEMFHYYHAQRYPKTWERTGQANKTGGDAYWNDRGENLAKAFAQQYVTFKNIKQERLGDFYDDQNRNNGDVDTF